MTKAIVKAVNKPGYDYSYPIAKRPEYEYSFDKSLLVQIEEEKDLEKMWLARMRTPKAVRNRMLHFKKAIIYHYTRKDRPKTINWLASKYRVTPHSIRYYLKQWGVKIIRRRGSKLDPFKDQIIALYTRESNPLTAKEIGNRFGFAEPTIGLALNKWGIPARDYVRVPPDWILSRYKDNWTPEQMAERLGVPPSSVYKVLVDKFGIRHTKKKLFTRVQDRWLKYVYGFRGMSVPQVEMLFAKKKWKGFTDTILRRRIKELRLRRRLMQNLTNKDIDSILGLAKIGLPVGEISIRLLLPEGKIVEILDRFAFKKHNRWQHVQHKAAMINKIKALRNNGASINVITASTGLTKAVAWEVIRRYKIRGGHKVRQHSKEYLDRLADRIRTMRAQKNTIKQMASDLGVSTALVTRVINAYNIPFTRRVFDEPTRKKIVELFKKGFHYSEMAKMLNLRDDSVRQEILHLGLPKHDRPWNKRFPPNITQMQNDFMRKYYSRPYFLSKTMLAKLLRIDKTTVEDRLKKMRFKLRTRVQADKLRMTAKANFSQARRRIPSEISEFNRKKDRIIREYKQALNIRRRGEK